MMEKATDQRFRANLAKTPARYKDHPTVNAPAGISVPPNNDDGDRVHVTRGLCAGDVAQAAQLYWQAFGSQILPLPVAPCHGRTLVLRALRPDRALVARVRGQLVGIAGLRDAGGGLLEADPRELIAVWGPVRGRLLRLSMRAFRPGPDTADLVIDGIAVDPDRRRRGIGRALVLAAAAQAAARGFPGLRAEVAAENDAGRALYSSLDFESVTTARVGWWPGRPTDIMRLPVQPRCDRPPSL